MKQFLKRLLCSHYWNDGESLTSRPCGGPSRFTCVKCGKQRVRKWNYGIHNNVSKDLS